MTVGDLKDLLDSVDDELNVYFLRGAKSPLTDGALIDRAVVISSDTDESAEGVYLKI